MENSVLLYEGKAKKIFSTDKKDEVIVYYKDDATAFNGEKKGVKTHFIKKIDDRQQLCKRVEIVPLEVIVRNVAAGSMAKRYGIVEGTELKTTVLELSYKNDELGDPLINDYHAVAMGLTTFEELLEIYDLASEVNDILRELFLKQDINLIDFKLEFGRFNGEILLADEISPDTCRFWDIKTGEKLDKDRFRRDLGNVREAYEEILSRIDHK